MEGFMHLKFWGAAGEVTGSCHLIHSGPYRIVIDCGLIQGTHEDEERNRDPFPFNPGDIDAVILTHAHLDHSGRLPMLVKDGFRGKIFTQHASLDLCRIMLKDSAHLNEKEAQWKNRKLERKHKPLVEPLYCMEDAVAALRRFKGLDYDQSYDILPGVRVRLRDAGHILGSSIVELWLKEKGVERKVVFSGDLGHANTPILRNPAVVDEAALVIMESTYGDRCHRSWEDTELELAEIFKDSRANRGNIMVPAFAVGRTQEILYTLGRNRDKWGIDRWQIFLDSPMAIEATGVYAKHTSLYDKETLEIQNATGNPFMLPNLTLSHTANQSMAINRIHDGAIIIAGSGMCDGGRIRHHFKHNIWRSECKLLIVGFQARGTLGRSLVEGAKEIRLWGERVRVAAKVHTIGGLSAHADADGLVRWYGGFKGRPPVALVHGEPESISALSGRLKNSLGASVLVPAPGSELDLVTMRKR